VAGVPDARVIGAQPGDVIQVGSLRIHPVPARHGIHMTDAYTFGQELSDGDYRYLGYVVELDGVRIYHDQALFKESGGGYTPMHQDHYYWPLDTDQTITMWMPLVDLRAEVGGMRFASGSQNAGFLGELPISDRSEEVLKQLIEERNFRLVETGAINAGDATFHSGWTLHGAQANTSPMMREVMTIIYFGDGAHVTAPESEGQRSDLHTWFQGLGPGDVAAGELNPLVYSKRAVSGSR